MGAWGIDLDLSVGKLYWTDDTRIMRANLDGSNPEGVIVTEEIEPHGIALDLKHGRMYWADFGSWKIRRSNLDGSDMEDVAFTEWWWPEGIAVDPTGEKVYWTQNESSGPLGRVRRANLDGSNIEDLVFSDYGTIGAMTLDLLNGKIYFVYWRMDIYRCNLDGSNVEFVIPWTGAWCDAVAVDPVGGKVYWSVWEPEYEVEVIRRANLDGSDVEDIVLESTPSLALDVEGGKIYYIRRDGYYVSRANLDGSEREGVIYTGDIGQGLALDLRVPMDCSEDRTIDPPDHAAFVNCLTGPGGEFAPGCSCADENGDRDVDLSDFSALQNTFAPID